MTLVDRVRGLIGRAGAPAARAHDGVQVADDIGTTASLAVKTVAVIFGLGVSVGAFTANQVTSALSVTKVGVTSPAPAATPGSATFATPLEHVLHDLHLALGANRKTEAVAVVDLEALPHLIREELEREHQPQEIPKKYRSDAPGGAGVGESSKNAAPTPPSDDSGKGEESRPEPSENPPGTCVLGPFGRQCRV